MKTFLLQILGLFILIVVGLMLSTNSGVQETFLKNFQGNGGKSTSGNLLEIIDVNEKNVKAEVKIEIADTDDKKIKGLGGRESLGEDEGMLFLYSKKQNPKFWMKGMKIPLDFIWISGDVVVDLLPKIPPPDVNIKSDSALALYSSTSLVDKVLEVNAGFIEKHNIKVGDLVKLKK